MGKNKNSKDIKVALISFWGLVIAAVVGGLFSLVNHNQETPTKPDSDVLKVAERDTANSAKDQPKVNESSSKTKKGSINPAVTISGNNGPTYIGNTITTNNNNVVRNDSLNK